jgi:hypothetical protein
MEGDYDEPVMTRQSIILPYPSKNLDTSSDLVSGGSSASHDDDENKGIRESEMHILPR